jgi:hypothetical protein
MRDDLLHAQASIDWPVSQLPSLEKQLRIWLRDNIEITTRDSDPNVPNEVVAAVEKTPFPLKFMVEAGAYINAIRSSLDILACALAHRYGMPDPDDHYFPVAPSQRIFESLRGYKGSEFVQGLPQSERVKIESLQPYEGGNKTLCALHRLDIVRKHKRLIEPAVLPHLVTVSAWGFQPSDVFTPVAHWISGNGETVLGLLKKDRVDEPKIKIAPYIAIYETGPFHRREVIETIRTFAALANSAVKLFDQ